MSDLQDSHYEEIDRLNKMASEREALRQSVDFSQQRLSEPEEGGLKESSARIE